MRDVSRKKPSLFKYMYMSTSLEFELLIIQNKTFCPEDFELQDSTGEAFARRGQYCVYFLW